MSEAFKTYRIRDFVRKNASGELDFERSKSLARELATVAVVHKGHNILLDLRDTKAFSGDLSQVLEVVMTFTRALPVFSGQIATIIPNEPERENHASMVASLMQLRDVDYRYFTDYEAALDWLADIETYGKTE